MWKLVIEDDEGKRTVVPLSRDGYSIGRKEGNTIRLTERNVSREHAKLAKNGVNSTQGGQSPFVLSDCTSYNGVFINGLRVADPQHLCHGDLIQIGDYRIVIQDDSVVDETAPLIPIDESKTTLPLGASARVSLLLERPDRLVMLAGPTPGTEYPLDKDRMIIGRAEDAEISVNHNSVSRFHCEIHALGEGRFEIVDKGSSNGVRVNASDLKRGIIEAGDVVELGDVRFKFVGAGQIFVPGANESQRFQSIADRPPGQVAKSSGVGIWFLLGVMLATVGLAGYVVYERKSTPTPDQLALDEARSLCDTQRCEGAREKLAQIAEGSPVRSGEEFPKVLSRWADATLAQADDAGDPAKKRELLLAVESDPLVDEAHHATARAKLAALAVPTESAPPSATAPGSGVPSAGPPASAGTSTSPTASATEATTAIPPDTSSSPPTNTSDTAPSRNPAGSTPHAEGTKPPKTTPKPVVDNTDWASAALTDPQGAKKALLGKISTGKPLSAYEKRALVAICKPTGPSPDQVCLTAANSATVAP